MAGLVELRIGPDREGQVICATKLLLAARQRRGCMMFSVPRVNATASVIVLVYAISVSHVLGSLGSAAIR